MIIKCFLVFLLSTSLILSGASDSTVGCSYESTDEVCIINLHSLTDLDNDLSKVRLNKRVKTLQLSLPTEASIGSLTDLFNHEENQGIETLIASEIGLKKTDGIEKLTKLMALNLSGNRNLTAKIRGLDNLRFLDMKNCDLEDFPLVSIPKKLERVLLTDNQIKQQSLINLRNDFVVEMEMKITTVDCLCSFEETAKKIIEKKIKFESNCFVSKLDLNDGGLKDLKCFEIVKKDKHFVGNNSVEVIITVDSKPKPDIEFLDFEGETPKYEIKKDDKIDYRYIFNFTFNEATTWKKKSFNVRFIFFEMAMDVIMKLIKGDDKDGKGNITYLSVFVILFALVVSLIL